MQNNREEMSDWETIIAGEAGWGGFLLVLGQLISAIILVGLFVYFGG